MPSIESLSQFPANTGRCIIRFFDPSRDVDQLQKAADNHNVFRYLNNRFPHPYTSKDAEEWTNLQSYEAQRQRIESAKDENVGLSLCIEIDGLVSGCIVYRFGSDLSQRIVTVGYWFAERVWGKGYATECIRWLVDFVAREEPIAVRIEAGAFAPNIGSRRVLEKSGFVLESVQRAAIAKGKDLVYDRAMMVYLLEDHIECGTVRYVGIKEM
ncbi:acyl-CoA N-acyltransferase [Cladochytrium replicatum]|nr:acyl-CoA N-acyltransferase [Cladochytrium replicatum]